MTLLLALSAVQAAAPVIVTWQAQLLMMKQSGMTR
jgi:hypothetical protein